MDQSVLVDQLRSLGLRRGDVVMVHSSFKALAIADPELIISALLETLGESGALLMPALSYEQQPPDIHNTDRTPSCVGFLPEYFRRRLGTLRSLHPTHSVCGVGAQASSWLGDHLEDNTPCGPHSPFYKLLHSPGKILMLGCGLKPNTTMHALEEHAPPPYLFAAPKIYILTDAGGRMFEKEYIPHNFQSVTQRYDRIANLLMAPAILQGKVGNASSFLIRGEALLEAPLSRLQAEPFYFVDR
jgi:aminoglycoside 3-N-acetyltransferase